MNPVILIAEDVLVNRLLVKSYITNDFPDFRILEAGNGEEAVSLTFKHNPDIIFMDLHMPVKNGYQAAQEIRESEKTSKSKTPAIIIALSADVTTGVQDKCMQNGMNGYLQKPFKTYDIRNILKKYLNTAVQDKNSESINPDNLPHEFIRKDLMDRLNGNIPLFQKLAEVAISQLTADIENLKKSIEKSDLSAVKMANHSIKGVSLNLYFSRLAELAKKIEGEYEFDKIRYLELTEKMTQEFEIIKAELTKNE
jgi:CheY-like chemotaxis protein/HPt (histidine-containing phosphotransfer) domain-containing protein